MGFTEDRKALKLLRLQDEIIMAKIYRDAIRKQPGMAVDTYKAEKYLEKLEAKLEKLLALRS